MSDYQHDGAETIKLSHDNDEITVWPSVEAPGSVTIALLDSEEPRTNVGIASPAECAALIAAIGRALGRPAPTSTPPVPTPDDGETGLRLNPVRVRIAAEVVSVREARGCNDWEWPAYVPKAERLSLIHDYHTWNGDPEEAVGRTSIGLSSVKAYLLAALLKHARETVTR